MVTIPQHSYQKPVGGVLFVVDQKQLNSQYYEYIQQNFQNLGYEETYKHLTRETFQSIKQVFDWAVQFSHKEYLDYQAFKKGAENALQDYRKTTIKQEIERELKRVST